MAAYLSRLASELGNDLQAMEFSAIAEQTASEDDVDSQVLWRAARAPILGRSGDLAQGEAVARRAVEIAQQTEVPRLQADSLWALGEVLHQAGQHDEAKQHVAEVLRLFNAKGDVVSAGRARAWLQQAGP